MKEPMISKEQLKSWLEHFSIREISKKFNIPVSTVYNYARKYNLLCSRACPVTKEELEALLKENTLAETGAILGRSPNSVYLWKKRFGITAKKGGRAVPDDFKEYIKRHTRKETAEHYGVSYEAVRLMEQKTNTRCSLQSIAVLEKQEDLPILLKYFTQEEVAKKFHVSSSTVKEWLRKAQKGNDDYE